MKGDQLHKLIQPASGKLFQPGGDCGVQADPLGARQRAIGYVADEQMVEGIVAAGRCRRDQVVCQQAVERQIDRQSGSALSSIACSVAARN